LDTNPRVLDLLIDGIQAESKAEKRAAGFKALRNLADGLSATFTGISVSGDPAPPWMEPPLKASHSIRGVPGKWITVETDVEAIPVIERALATAIHNPLLDDQIQPEVWLDWQSRPSSDTAFPSDTALLFDKAFLEVHLGDQTVATLDADTTSLFRIHMETAATEGLVPVIKGRLTRTSEPPGHRLEIQSPANQ
jgi:hypothetical protein